MIRSTNLNPAFPPTFLHRMEGLLGEEYPEFLTALQGSSPTGIRVNTLKVTAAGFTGISPFQLEPVPWCPAGFTLPRTPADQPQPGRHPYHAAGLYYVQDPSAMAVAELLDPQPGELILDLAAAPGGKATHLASQLGNQGVLVANEIHPIRVWDLAENLERWGARNVVILNERPERLAASLGPVFDRVLVDAPCSGEGMFRKNPSSRTEWNTELVRGCSVRQRAILEAAAGLVRPGGWLAYTTCTFNPDENEGSLASFLDRNPQFEIAKTNLSSQFSPGRPDWLDYPTQQPLKDSVRLWPHQLDGEGHFIALLHRGGIEKNTPRGRSGLSKPSKELQRAFKEFCSRTRLILADYLHLGQQGSYLYHSPPGLPDLSGLRLVHPGWWLGIWKKDRFEPSHALALAIYTDDDCSRIDLSLKEPGPVYAYLRGESLRELPASAPVSDGWALTNVDGFSLGWVKLVQGVAKNYYPRGLRRS